MDANIAFPKSAAVAATAERTRWDLADALREEIATYPSGAPKPGQFKAAREYIRKENGSAYDESTLRNMWRTAGAFGPNERLWKVSFKHYETVLPEAPEDRAPALSLAETHGWTIWQLSDALGRSSSGPAGNAPINKKLIERAVTENPELVAEALAEDRTGTMAFHEIQERKHSGGGGRDGNNSGPLDDLIDQFGDLLLIVRATKLEKMSADALKRIKLQGELAGLPAEKKAAIVEQQRLAAAKASNAADNLKSAAMLVENPELGRLLT